MSPSWKTLTGLVFSLTACAGGETKPSLTVDSAKESSDSQMPQMASTACPSSWSVSTEIAPSVSFVRLNTINAALEYGFEGSFAGVGVQQRFGYGESLRLSLSGAYSRTLSGSVTGIYSGPMARGQVFDATAEVALSLAADDERHVCFEPFVGYAFLDLSLNAQIGVEAKRSSWDHLRYYGPMAGLGLSLLPVEALRMGVKLGFARSHLWDKRPTSTVYKGENRLYTLMSSLRFDYSVTEGITTHANVDYQGWSAVERYIDAPVVPYLRRVTVGFGVKVAY